jgi:glutathione S-transferase
MKLYTTDTSPFVRKVWVAACELGLSSRIERVTLRPTPIEASPQLSAHNPLSKIPALVLDDGSAIYDSPVICEYLDTLHAGSKLVPAAGSARFDVLRRQALCDGILDAGILVYYELNSRPSERHWTPWIAGQRQKANQGLDALEHEVDRFGFTLDLSHICVGVTLGWLEFRKPLGDVRPGRPRLFAWHDAFRQRASMVDSEPRA